MNEDKACANFATNPMCRKFQQSKSRHISSPQFQIRNCERTNNRVAKPNLWRIQIRWTARMIFSKCLRRNLKVGSRKNNQWNQEEQKRNRLADKIWKSPRKKKRATSPKLIGSTPHRPSYGGFYPQREVISAEPPLHPVPQPTQ